MEVLVYFASHVDEVITREELEANVWHGAGVGYDAVTKTIIKLRKALQDDARHPRYIVTIPKKGYQLIIPVISPAFDKATVAQARSTHKHLTNSLSKQKTIFGILVLLIFITAYGVFYSSDDTSNSAINEESPQQSEMPFAVVQGAAYNTLPLDLYIPPDALEVFLAETFEGPLDLLLYLIKKQNLEILDLPIAEITRQYVEYVSVMTEIQLELAGEYLVMAAMLAEIKSRMLLPRPKTEEVDEGNPRAALVRRLQEYERFKQAAEDIDQLPRMGRIGRAQV